MPPNPFQRVDPLKMLMSAIIVCTVLILIISFGASFLIPSARNALANTYVALAVAVFVLLFVIPGLSKIRLFVRFFGTLIARLARAWFGTELSHEQKEQWIGFLLFLVVFPLVMAWLLGYLGF